MTKKRILLATVIAASLLLIAAIIFFFVTKGTIEEKDGLLQNSRVYMENVRYEDGEIRYTLVNKTRYELYDLPGKPHIQRKTDDGWKMVSYSESTTLVNLIIPAFYKNEYSFRVANTRYFVAGEYRLIFGTPSSTKSPCIVGYFTVPAPVE